MKKKLICVTLLLIMVLTLVANDSPSLGRTLPSITLPQGKTISRDRTSPAFTFSCNPNYLLFSYYDYMIGSYNSLPLRVIPQSGGGGYFMTYHGRRTPTSTRRAFYTHLDATGNIVSSSEITDSNAAGGYPTVAVDPVSGKPFYAWQANYDTDAAYEVPLTSDAFFYGLSGLFNDLVLIEDGPITITPSNAAPTSDNEFIWPTAQIGPSPIAGKRRVYIIMRNSITHTYGPSENPYIRFADFDATDIEEGTALNWNTAHFTIPEMDDWNHDDQWRCPYYALAVDNSGNVYLCGYHSAIQADGATPIIEADMDVFKCTNYGEGIWTRFCAFSNLPSWNPPTSLTDSTGYFEDEYGIPYADNELQWVLMNSGHLNVSIDDNGKIHVPGLWGLQNSDGFFYPSLQFMKEYVFDPNTSQFSIREIYPKKDYTNIHDNYLQPWDTISPWGEVDSFGGDDVNGHYPNMTTDWNFPYWDSTVHSGGMMQYYNNAKITECNGEGMMAVVWQNSQRARWANEDNNPAYSTYTNTPEIYISVSPDNGNTWSEPIILNNIQTPELAGIKPMWVYPADKIIFEGMQGIQKVGKLGLMFFDDYTWGSNSITPPVHPYADGGRVMFTELRIVFPPESTFPPEPPTTTSSFVPITIPMNSSNDSLDLSEYFSDISQQLTYTCNGNTYITCNVVSDSILVLVPDQNWYGVEYITIRATNVWGLYIEQILKVTVIQTWQIAENFNHEGNIPTNWGTSHSGTTDYPWQPVLIAGNEYTMKTKANTGTTANERLISPTFNLTGYKDIVVSFSTDFLPYGAGTGTFAYSLNNVTYTTIETYNASGSDIKSYAIPILNNKPSVKFRWTYNNSNANTGQSNHWSVDNFNIIGAVMDTQAPSEVIGLTVESQAFSSTTLTWQASSEIYFGRYELYISTDSTVTTSDQLWSTDQDIALYNALTTHTTITDLGSGEYWIAIRAVDQSNNASPLSDVVHFFHDDIAPSFSNPIPINQPEPEWLTSRTVEIGCTIVDNNTIDPNNIWYRIDSNGNGSYDPNEDWNAIPSSFSAHSLRNTTDLLFNVTVVTDGSIKFEFKATDLNQNTSYSGIAQQNGIEDDWVVRIDTMGPDSLSTFFTQEITDTSVQLGWMATFDLNFLGYRIYYSTSPDILSDYQVWDWNNDANLGIAGTGLINTTITGLYPATRYYFLLLAIDEVGWITQYPAIITSMTTSVAAPMAPDNVVISIIGDQLILDWDDVTIDIQGNAIVPSYYEVYVGDTPDFICTYDTMVGTAEQSHMELYDVVEYADKLFFKVVAVSGAIRSSEKTRKSKSSEAQDIFIERM